MLSGARSFEESSDAQYHYTVGFFNHVFCILSSFINFLVILPTSSVFCPSRFFSNLKLAEGAVGFCILHSASILPPQTAPHPAFGFWILDSEGIWLPLRWGAILGIGSWETEFLDTGRPIGSRSCDSGNCILGN